MRPIAAIGSALALSLSACSSATGTPAPETATSVTSGPDTSSAGGLPPMTRFQIGDDGVIYDCRTDGTAVTCAVSWNNRLGGMTSYEGDFTGTLSGLTMTGTTRIRTTSWDQMDPQCIFTDEISGPITYTFGLDGTGTLRDGPATWYRTNSGSCSGSQTGTYPLVEESRPWTKAE